MHLTNLASAQFLIWNVLGKYNKDPGRIFRIAGIDPSSLAKPGARTPLYKIKKLWQEADRQIGDPCFGLKVADNWHPSNFGTLGYALLASKSLRMTLERMLRFHKVISDVRFGQLRENRHPNSLSFLLTMSLGPDAPGAWEDAALALIMSVLRLNYQQELTPNGVDITHPKPQCVGRYYEFFQAPVRFDTETAALHLPQDLMDRELPGHHEELAEFSDQMMSRYIANLGAENLVSRVRKAIVDLLPSGTATVDKVASNLFVSTRTLQRMLRQEETTFLELLNDTRRELAITYVQDRKIELTEVAFLLGFSELSTFSRSFKRWTGSSPTQFRKAA